MSQAPSSRPPSAVAASAAFMMSVFTGLVAPVLYALAGLLMHGSPWPFWALLGGVLGAAVMVIVSLVLAIQQLAATRRGQPGRWRAVLAILLAVASPFTGAFGLFWAFIFLTGSHY